MNCLINKQLQWKFRLKKEVLYNDLAFWLTLQYDDEHLFIPDIGDGLFRPAVCKQHCQNYFRQLRKSIKSKELPVIMRYFLVSEYGPRTNRPHYHCLFLFRFTDDFSLEFKLKYRQIIYELLRKHWYHGHVHEELFHSGVVSYLTKYCLKPQSDYDPPLPTFRLISLGIGREYLNSINFEEAKKRLFLMPEGYLPRYYRDKILPPKSVLSNHRQQYSIDEYQSLLIQRKEVSDKLMNKVYENSLKEAARFDSFEDFIKNQEMLRSHQRAISEKKLKKKYG